MTSITTGPADADAKANADADADADATPAPVQLACLCAAWCHTCTAYRATFDTVAAEFGAQLRPHWIDIEDDEALLGQLDVVDFPTLLIARGDHVAFFGPVLPHAQTLRQLVQRALHDQLVRVQPAVMAGVAGVAGQDEPADLADPTQLARHLAARG
jgi:thioredoxin-like negative regulator of GroEL